MKTSVLFPIFLVVVGSETYYGRTQSSDDSVKFLLIGAATGDVSETKSMEYYYPHRPSHNRLVNVTLLNPRGRHTSVVLRDGKVMTMAGQLSDSGDATNKMEIYDPITNTITQGKNMTIARMNCASATINGIVYICGGWDEKHTLASCERYRNGKWDKIASMQQERSGLALVSLNGHLYAIGGYGDHSGTLNSVEKYNPDFNSWVLVKPMHTARSCHGAAVLNGSIYVCEGYETHSCERYHPELNKWSNVTPMIKACRTNEEEFEFPMVSDGHNLFAFTFWRNVCMYNPEKDKWSLIKPTIYCRWGASAVVLH